MNWLKEHQQKHRHKKFINDLTFGEVYKRVMVLTGKLLPFVKDEKRVALLSNNSVDMALFFLGLQYMGKEVLMLNARLTEVEIREQLDALDINVVFSQDERFISFAKVSETVDREMERHNIECHESKSYCSNLLEEQHEHNNLKSPPCMDRFDEEAVAVIMNTSATTGKFKSVPIKWRQFASHVEASRQNLGMLPEDNWLITLPMYHIGGLAILIRSLFNGTAVTIMEKFDPAAVKACIRRGDVNMISVVPTMLNDIIDDLAEHRLRVVLVGGEFIPDDLVRKCLLKKVPVYKTYGMTETTSQSTTFEVAAHPGKMASVGRPLNHVEVEVRNPDDQGVGEICIKSPMVMEGYVGMEKMEGYFRTGDAGYVDQDGFLYVMGRFKDIIISGGENIYPKELEDILYNHPLIHECAIVGKNDPKWGEVPYLYIVSSLSEKEIMYYLSGRVAGYKLPKAIVKMTALPRNNTGKVQKRVLKKMAEEEKIRGRNDY